MWSWPRPRTPQTATRTRSFAPRILPPSARAAAPAVIAFPVVFRNSRRSIAMVATFVLETILHAAYYILRSEYARFAIKNLFFPAPTLSFHECVCFLGGRRAYNHWP